MTTFAQAAYWTGFLLFAWSAWRAEKRRRDWLEAAMQFGKAVGLFGALLDMMQEHYPDDDALKTARETFARDFARWKSH